VIICRLKEVDERVMESRKGIRDSNHGIISRDKLNLGDDLDGAIRTGRDDTSPMKPRAKAVVFGFGEG
jgi:hypothetical protein